MASVENKSNIGVSPSGKASDSDSDISGVRIPVPQPKKFLGLVPRIFFYLFTLHFSLISPNEEFFEVIGKSE